MLSARSVIIAAAGLAAITFAPGLTEVRPTPVQAESITIAMVENVFEPAVAAITAGDVVTWTNKGQVIHMATDDNGSFDSGIVSLGGSYAIRFDQPGVYSYTCIIHPQTMKGTLFVVAPVAAPAVVESFPPAESIPPAESNPPTE